MRKKFLGWDTGIDFHQKLLGESGSDAISGFHEYSAIASLFKISISDLSSNK